MAEHVLTETFFESFDLHPQLQKGLAGCGFTRCTPIQALALPIALTGRDVAGQAQTGTGKTCAFLVALMNQLLTKPAMANRKDSDPRALIIAPTRELAIQIEKDARAIGQDTELRMALIYGGVDYDKQRQQLRDGCDIIIATPGRLLDYYKQHVFALDSIEVMVIDEADRMFDLGFIKDVRYIFRRLPARDERQVLLFSATLSHRVLELAYEHMNEAEKVVVETDNVTADKVRQVVYFPAKEEKMPLLLNLIEQHKPKRSIVFANTKAAVERVKERLRKHGYRVGALSGDVPQVKRQKLLQRFKDSQIDMLVATDVAARGLHIPAVSHVFNYDLPQDAEDYVHRIGRTARLGAEGDAISFACDLYAMGLPDIESYIEQKIPVEAIDPAMLKMPRPLPQSAHLQDDDDDAPDTPTGAQGDGSGSGGSRKRGRGRGGPRSVGSSTGSRSQARGESPQTVTPEQAPAAAPQAPASGAPADGSGSDKPRRRRRRGGRGGRGRGGEGEASQGSTSAGRSPKRAGDDAQANGPRKDNRERPGTKAKTPSPAKPSGSRQVHAEPAPSATSKPRKAGFFKRLFGGS
ncbi:DEAD/DEAH box helicase [Oleiagrimonas sp.]|jgi:ATP-dependent RNA helicase RhlB|uniref:DEAD/DEAH box helicase n=1 Tax=Oleiagrimonas sp. TaxID=2010330 RepID=UPI00260491D0|nr:DEAD/DEAH box helicase [Oleiagrimonas sp.]MDA3915144.1 DEAD/DEAH box helicase [Oleiagrimonas sp.]